MSLTETSAEPVSCMGEHSRMGSILAEIQLGCSQSCVWVSFLTSLYIAFHPLGAITAYTVITAGEEYVEGLAERLFQGDAERAGQRILKDFRNLALGRMALELPDRR